MTSLPATEQTDAVMQNPVTGVVTYLQYEGNTLTELATRDYGLGSTWKIVAGGDFQGSGSPEDLVAQNRTTGQLDFLYLDANGRLVSSALSGVAPPIVAEGFFGAVSGQVGPTLIAQLQNGGAVDFLTFNASGQLNGSDLIPIPLPRVVGATAQDGESAALNGISNSPNDSLVTQLPDGSIDVIGFVGSVAGGLGPVASDLLAQTVGTAPVVAVNPDFSSVVSGQTTSEDVPGVVSTTFGLQLLTQNANGQLGTTYIDSGYGEVHSTEGDVYATNQLGPSFSGQQFVDGGFVGQELLPVSPTATLPVPVQTDVAVQDPVSGIVDYLEFVGNKLTFSDAHDYGIAGYRIVGEGDFNSDTKPDLLAQKANGIVDILLLGAGAQLTGSAMGSTALAPIVGSGNFETAALAGQAGEVYVSQLGNGELDFLAFNANAQLIASDLVTSTVGIGKVVGVGQGFNQFQAFSGVGSNATVITQGSDGSLTALGFSGAFNTASLSLSSTLLLPQSAGDPAVGTINPNTGGAASPSQNINGISGQETVQMIGEASSGQVDAMYFDSGFGGNSSTEGNMFASSLQTNAFLGGDTIVNAGSVAHFVFPITFN